MNEILLGFGIAFLGLLPPGMLNMTTMRVSIEFGLQEGLKFAMGASVIVGIHSYLAFSFSEYLVQNPDIIQKLEYTGILVFLILSVFFYVQSRKKFQMEGNRQSGNKFISGLMMSSMNMLGIPFYLGTSIALSSKHPGILEGTSKLLLVMGALLGSFALFTTYGVFAKIIKKRAAFIAENINMILAILFLILGIILSIKQMK